MTKIVFTCTKWDTTWAFTYECKSRVCVTSSHVHQQVFPHMCQVWLKSGFQWKFSWLLYVLSSLEEPVRSKKKAIVAIRHLCIDEVKNKYAP